MRDTEYKRLIDSAKERALFGFLALVQRAMQDADRNIVQLMATAKSGADQSALSSLRHFLRQDGSTFLRRIDALYKNYLERAMQTMYVDMRPGMSAVSADDLSLIDDEVVNHQIEVGRLAARMRDASEENIGRLNVIVAQLHGEREARERENPFRPYLLARAMYEASRETAADEPKSAMLFDHLSDALIQHLPGYYGAVREVFEASGVYGKYVALPSRTSHHQRYFGAPPDMPPLPVRLESRLAPALQRVLEAMQTMPADQAAVGPAYAGEQAATVQEFIRKMLNPSRSLVRSPGAAFRRDASLASMAGKQKALPPSRLVAQLDAFQKAAICEQTEDEKAAGAAPENKLFALREKLDLGNASAMERMIVEVVAMLFEFMLDDTQIPPELRQHIGRLQIPVLKAAMLAPELLQDERHPARELLNRLSSAAVATDPASQEGRKLVAEIDRIAGKVSSGFDTDMTIFSATLREFEQFLETHVRRGERATSHAVDAVEVAEKLSILLTNTRTSLVDVLLTLNIDKRLSDFIIRIWPHVLVHAAWRDLESKTPVEQADSLFQQYRAVLPELVWSVQEKQEMPERSALMRLLPDLVKRLTGALQLSQLPQDECREMLDQLMFMHTQVLRTGAKNDMTNDMTNDMKHDPARPPALEELRRDFGRLNINWERVSWSLAEPPQPRTDLIEEVLALRGVGAELNVGVEAISASEADREFLAQTYLLGTRVEMRAEEGDRQPAQLAWVSTHRSLYLFRQERDAALTIYTSAALLEALRVGRIVPVEYAPVFERAVESLLFGAEKIKL